MIADNERMVQNVLGAVAQLTHGRTPDRVKHQAEVESPLAKEDTLADVDVAPTPPRDVAPPAPTVSHEVAPPPASRGDQMIAENEKMVQSVLREVAKVTVARSTQQVKVQALAEAAPLGTVATKMTIAASPQVQSAADEYLATETPARPQPKSRGSPVQAQPSDDSISAHLPESVSWSNPYTFTASSNAPQVGAAPMRENSYLKDIDLGVAQVRLPPKTPDDENPYLQGLDLTGAPSQAAPASVSASALTAMHQNQLLSSHTLLSSFDGFDDTARQPIRHQSPTKASAPKDHLRGFLGPARQALPKKALVSQNAYLAKLGSSDAAAAASSSSSALASQVEQDNPYLQALDDAPQMLVAQPARPAQPSLRAVESEHSSVFKMSSSPAADNKRLSMASSRQAVQNKAVQHTKSKTVAKKKNEHALSSWIGGAAQAPDPRAQRLRAVVAQRVADSKNPYLQGLDIDGASPKVQATPPSHDNPYMASLD
jgi:hypothetical protein